MPPFPDKLTIMSVDDEAAVEAFDVVNAAFRWGVSADGDDELTHALQAYMKEQMASSKYPRPVEYVDELPTIASGKTRCIDLRERNWFGE